MCSSVVAPLTLLRLLGCVILPIACMPVARARDWPTYPEDGIPGYDWNAKVMDCERQRDHNGTAFAPAPKERCDFANKWVKIKDSELPFYYPHPCDRCRLAAEGKKAVKACAGVCQAAWAKRVANPVPPKTKFFADEHQAFLNHFDPANGDCMHENFVRERNGFRRRLAKLPPGDRGDASQVFTFHRALKGRPAFYIGDSITNNFIEQIEERSRQVKGNFSFEPSTIFDYPLHDHKSPFRFMKHKKVTREDSKWKQWHRDAINALHELNDRDGRGTVLFINAGLHFHHRSDFDLVLERMFALLEDFLALHPANVAVYVESTAQHFPTATGGYCAMNQLDDGNPMKRSLPPPPPLTPWEGKTGARYPCVAPPSRGERGKGASSKSGRRKGKGAESPVCDKHTQWETQWRNEYAHALVQRRHPQVGVAPVGALTMPFWDIHTGGDHDCTHFCYAPALVEAVLHLLTRSLAAADEKRVARSAAELHLARNAVWASRQFRPKEHGIDPF